MLKRTMAMLCLLASVWALAGDIPVSDSDVMPVGENCVCSARLKIGHAPEGLPPAATSFTLHDLGPGEHLTVRLNRSAYTHGFCWWDSCNTQRECQLWINVTWEATNPAGSGRTWILDIGGPYGAMITHLIPPGTFNPGAPAGTIKVDRCGGDDFITFNLTIDGITVHVPVSIWCEPCEDSDTDI